MNFSLKKKPIELDFVGKIVYIYHFFFFSQKHYDFTFKIKKN